MLYDARLCANVDTVNKKTEFFSRDENVLCQKSFPLDELFIRIFFK